jgi:hypothetical protein
MTTMLAAVRTPVMSQNEAVVGSNPMVKLAKLRFTDERVDAPKKDAADIPRRR